ncbi:ketopantoate reductase family protein [Clostridium sp. AM58-1XD]|uniref:ketopantoate reductase family protein n=1 Tax=Clostridium sp. AM58-1XD TaxID=2292307 RepID=UPI000E4AA3E6|nr:ketopantoate reductase family protein [Clostridium sp. AM58-1XD]RGY96844.1 ketopantoate reductase family protein [Clostridium sp. AM58-1XD]
MKKLNHVTIVGMGALGILFGEYFARTMGSEAVTFLADEERIARYGKEMISCNGKECRFQLKTPDAAAQAELLVFAVKATALPAAVHMAEKCVGGDTVILSLLNGISSEEYIEKELGKGTVLSCVAQGMDAVKNGGRLTYSHMGKLCIGISKSEEEKRPQLERVRELFDRIELPYTLEEDIIHRMWSKWMLNVGVNQTVMVEEGTYRTVQEPGKARDLMKAAMREVIMIAEKEGVSVTEKDLDEYTALVDSLSPDGMPSMRQDGMAGRLTEVELFAGTVLKKAEQYGLEAPVNRELYDRVKYLESQYK